MLGDKQMFHGAIVFTSQYTTGGDAITPDLPTLLKQLGVGTVEMVVFDQGDGYIITYNQATNLLQVFTTANTELTGAPTNYPAALLAATPRMMVIGV